MAATVSVKQAYGTGPSTSTITNLRFSTDDNVNPGVLNPLVRPAVGINRSFAKTIYLNADTSPSLIINNVKIFTDGAIGWTGVTVYMGTVGSYTQATGIEGETGNDSSVATADFSSFTIGSPKRVTGEIENPATGRITDYVVLQADISTGAVPGYLSPETATFQYDEI